VRDSDLISVNLYFFELTVCANKNRMKLNTRKILVVEENVNSSIQMMIDELAQYEVIGRATNAEDGIAKIAQLFPDMVLVDAELKSEISGIEFGRRLQELQVDFILFSSRTDKASVANALSVAPLAFLFTPFDRATLLVNLELAFSRSERKHSG
jgi:DNA-binding NarL/FixJ family response regulator